MVLIKVQGKGITRTCDVEQDMQRSNQTSLEIPQTPSDKTAYGPAEIILLDYYSTQEYCRVQRSYHYRYITMYLQYISCNTLCIWFICVRTIFSCLAQHIILFTLTQLNAEVTAAVAYM